MFTLHSLMAFMSRLTSLSLSLYSGSKSTLKQVCADGKRSESGPFLAMINFSLEIRRQANHYGNNKHSLATKNYLINYYQRRVYCTIIPVRSKSAIRI
jgi:hypothetical protein